MAFGLQIIPGLKARVLVASTSSDLCLELDFTAKIIRALLQEEKKRENSYGEEKKRAHLSPLKRACHKLKSVKH